MTVESRLVEWGSWVKGPAYSYFPAETTLYRMIHIGQIGRSAQHSDGNLGALADLRIASLAFDVRAREVNSILIDLPKSYRMLIAVTYRDTPPRRWVTPVRTAAELLGLTVAGYRDAKKHALGWIAGRLCIPLPDSALAIKPVCAHNHNNPLVVAAAP